MPRATPMFPAFHEWQQMSEREQDALLDRFEAGQRRRKLASRLATFVVCAGGLTLGVALLVF